MKKYIINVCKNNALLTTTVRIIGKDSSDLSRNTEITITIDCAAEDAATHPRILRLINVLKKRFDIVEIIPA